MSQKRSDKELKKVLISQLGSKSNAVATGALKELDARGWLSDGALQGAYISSANLENNSFTGGDLKGAHLSFSNLRNTSWFETDLEGAFLDHVDLRKASLSIHAVGPHYAEANLKNVSLSFADLSGARIRHEQFIQTRSLQNAIMPDGELYDGCYNLEADINFAKKTGKNVNNAKEMALFYGVVVEKYLLGQARFVEFKNRNDANL
ncbi:MAG: pentapeptide repeat-containing protein [Anaerolineae bacterium]|nr:pentapeptide repeat-containing protein [Anaerolineae bacterium]MBT7324843.1 pentapeptide repeat-containing protein [Anaerolineae bacterium]